MKLYIEYFFKSKRYPVYLYNLYGSEGDRNTRLQVDAMIDAMGFWKAAKHIYNTYK